MDKGTSINSAIQLEEVLVAAITRIDFEMFREFIVYIEKYKDLDKHYLIKDLERVFDKFRKFGDTELKSNLGLCGKCHKDCYGHLFFGNNSKNYINILFEIKENKIVELTECSEFKLLSEVYDLNKRVYLHAYNDPESKEYCRI